MRFSNRQITGALIALAAVLFLPGLGAVPLFDWDEANFATIAMEMLRSGDYLRPSVSYLPFTEKPPLFFWLQTLAMHVVGISEYAARLPNALFGIITLPLLFAIGRRWINKTVGLLWALAYAGAFLPHLYFKSGIIDPVFNFFIFLGIYGLVMAHIKRAGMYTLPIRRSHWWYLLWAGVSTGLAILTKGPAALAIIGLTIIGVWVTYARFRWFLTPLHGLFYLLITALTASLWYGAEWIVHGPEFMVEFYARQVALFTTPDAGHSGFPGYHIVVLLLGCFPASLLAIPGHQRRKVWPAHYKTIHAWMVALLWVVIILFSIVESKIVHYSSMAYFPITFLAALYLQDWMHARRQWSIWLSAGLWWLGLLYAIVALMVPLVAAHPEWLQNLPVDPLTRASLKAEVSWPWYTLLPGLTMPVLLLGHTLLNQRNQHLKAKVFLFTGMALWINVVIALFLPRIEQYTQQGSIDLLQKHTPADAYVYTYGYRSYLPFFYHPLSREAIFTPAFKQFRAGHSKYPPTVEPAYIMHSQYLRDFILYGPLDKPGYLLLRTPQVKDFLMAHPQMELVAIRESYALVKRSRPTNP